MQAPFRSCPTGHRKCSPRTILTGSYFLFNMHVSEITLDPPVRVLSFIICSEEIIRRQGQVDKQYAGLKELAEDRRKKLDHTFHHFLLSREVEELEHWIAERDVVASSQEMGQDLDHVTVNSFLAY